MPIELSPEEFHIVSSLFTPDFPQRSIAFAIIEGRMNGRVLVDRFEHPASCMVISDMILSYCAGKPSREIWDDFLNFLQMETATRTTPIKLECPPEFDKGLLEIAKARGIGTMTRHQFYYQKRPETRIELGKIPEGLELKRIMNADLVGCGYGFVFSVVYAGGKYEKNTSSWCLVSKESDASREIKIVSESHGMIGDNEITIGVMTHKETDRQKGYAALVCQQVMHESGGKRVIWACDTNNPVSLRLAQKLHFVPAFDYDYLVCKPLAVAVPRVISESRLVITDPITSQEVIIDPAVFSQSFSMTPDLVADPLSSFIGGEIIFDTEKYQLVAIMRNGISVNVPGQHPALSVGEAALATFPKEIPICRFRMMPTALTSGCQQQKIMRLILTKQAEKVLLGLNYPPVDAKRSAFEMGRAIDSFPKIPPPLLTTREQVASLLKLGFLARQYAEGNSHEVWSEEKGVRP